MRPYTIVGIIRQDALHFAAISWSVQARHLQRTYSAGEIGIMQELEKHNLTRITNAPADFLNQFGRNFI